MDVEAKTSDDSTIQLSAALCVCVSQVSHWMGVSSFKEVNAIALIQAFG